VTRAALLLVALAGCVGGGSADPPPPASDAGVVVADARPANACGGTVPLVGRPGEACGTCGTFTCEGPLLVCRGDSSLNACGACGPLPAEECNGRDDDCDGVTDEGCVRRVLSDRFVSRVRVDGDWAVLNVAGAQRTRADVLLVQISTGVTRELVAERVARSGEARPVLTHGASIDGTRVAWIEDDSVNRPARVVAFDRATGAYRTRATSAPVEATTAIDGERVVYTGIGSGGSAVRLWDLATDVDGAVGSAGPADARPDVSGPWVVFERTVRTGGSQVVARRLDTGEERELSEGIPGAHFAPSVDGSVVVWHREEGNRARDSQVIAYDLATRAHRVISTAPRAFSAGVRGSTVCWSHRGDPERSDQRYGYDLTVMDLATGRSAVLGPRGNDCDVSARRVSWLGFHSAEAYWRDLLDGEP